MISLNVGYGSVEHLVLAIQSNEKRQRTTRMQDSSEVVELTINPPYRSVLFQMTFTETPFHGS